MADNKKYYYLKLKENFFETDDMKVIEKMPDGHLYSNILLKIYLKSLKNEGRLMFRDHIPYSPEMLAAVVNHPVAVVEKALAVFRQIDLIEVLDNGAIYMMDIQKWIGQDSTEAVRLREYRRRIKVEQGALACTNVQQSNDSERNGCTDVQLSNYGVHNSRTNEHQSLELRDKRLENKEKDVISRRLKKSPSQTRRDEEEKEKISEIVSYLNMKIGGQFKAYTKGTVKNVKYLLNEGFTVEDFKKVIDIKVKDWQFNKEYKEYLRPATLFNPDKFEGYLNKAVMAGSENHFTKGAGVIRV